jgi:hypothetical protein
MFARAVTFLGQAMKTNAKDDWPFDQPRDCAAFTMRQVVDRSEPILLVAHDAEDHGWQFIGRSAARTEDARLVAMEEIVKIDPTVLEVADLPPGWQAFRAEAGGRWSRRRKSLPPPDDEK